MQGHRAFAEELKAGKAKEAAGVTMRKQPPVLPECNSDVSLRRTKSGEVNGRKSEAMNRLPSKEGGSKARFD